ncbi:hypothetical protein EVAR_27019_1 [Eumeta japonica]|uniref:Secreted protein n=1 Tax=Eumeta variegata TaxID=151549 RepID=A0A4C1WGR2_EUMVA|nr:hypothetical protein EVAR_27019_1 [Eumeta japonica]
MTFRRRLVAIVNFVIGVAAARARDGRRERMAAIFTSASVDDLLRSRILLHCYVIFEKMYYVRSALIHLCIQATTMSSRNIVLTSFFSRQGGAERRVGYGDNTDCHFQSHLRSSAEKKNRAVGRRAIAYSVRSKSMAIVYFPSSPGTAKRPGTAGYAVARVELHAVAGTNTSFSRTNTLRSREALNLCASTDGGLGTKETDFSVRVVKYDPPDRPREEARFEQYDYGSSERGSKYLRRTSRGV